MNFYRRLFLLTASPCSEQSSTRRFAFSNHFLLYKSIEVLRELFKRLHLRFIDFYFRSTTANVFVIFRYVMYIYVRVYVCVFVSLKLLCTYFFVSLLISPLTLNTLQFTALVNLIYVCKHTVADIFIDT